MHKAEWRMKNKKYVQARSGTVNYEYDIYFKWYTIISYRRR